LNSTDIPSPNDSTPSKRDIARWVIACLVALVAVVFFIHAIDQQNVCHQQIVGESGHLVETCGPPRLLDLAPFALLIAVLLWPDLGELAVTGLFTLRRRVERQEERQGEVESHLHQVNQQLTQLATLSQAQAQGQTAVGTVNNYYAPDQQDLKRGIDSIEAGEQPADLAGLGRAEAVLQAEAQERERLLGEFVREYSRLEPYILPRGSRLAAELDQLDSDRRQLVDDWRVMFDREITALRQTRNAAVHQPGLVSPETLRGAIENTRELSRILFDRIG
jgi:hypothetical protein